MDDSLYLVERIKQVRHAIRDLEEGPPGSPDLDRIRDALDDVLRETMSDLRRERTYALGAIADDLFAAATRLKLAIRTDDLGDGTKFSDLDLQSLGTLFGHFDRAWDEIPEEWRVS